MQHVFDSWQVLQNLLCRQPVRLMLTARTPTFEPELPWKTNPLFVATCVLAVGSIRPELSNRSFGDEAAAVLAALRCLEFQPQLCPDLSILEILASFMTCL